MNEREQAIYRGLQAIGQEISTFFDDATKIFESDLKSKPYLLAHLAREIESGIRDVLCAIPEGEAKICETCKRPLNRKIGHKESIIKSLGLSEETEFVKKWYKTANNFNKYAHRHGAWKTPREKDEFDKLWKDFEDVLERLVGNYFAIADRLDAILKVENPTDQIINTLPNLLDNESRYSYFFQRLDSPKWLKPLYEKQYFDPSNNPEPREVDSKPGSFWFPRWGVLEFLEKIAQKNAQIPDDDLTSIIIAIVDDIAGYKNKLGNRIQNYITDYYIFRIISYLPSQRIADQHFNFIVESLKNPWGSVLTDIDFGKYLLDRFINEKNEKILYRLVEIIFDYSIDSSSFDKIHSIFKYNFLMELLSNYKDKIIEVCGIEVIQPAIKKLQDLITLDETLFNNITIPTIETSDQTFFPEKYECQLIYFIRDVLERVSPKESLPIVKDFLSKDHSIYIRVAFHTINSQFHFFKGLLWKFEQNPLEEYEYKHELYELLKAHVREFTFQEISQLLSWIGTISMKAATEYTEEQRKQFIVYQQKEWVTAIEASEDRRIQELKAKLDVINPSPIEHAGMVSWSSGIIGTSSPLRQEEIIEMDIKKFIQHFIDFSTEPKKFIGPSIEGLMDVFVSVVYEHPENYNHHCDSIIAAPTYVQYSWIFGLYKSWNEKKLTFDTIEIFKTVSEIIQKESFWKDNNESLTNNNANGFLRWLISFIEAGIQDEAHLFEMGSFHLIKGILLSIYHNDTSPINDMSELIMTMLNNSRGKIYSALFHYSYRIAQVEKRTVELWDHDISIIIKREIEQKADNPFLFFSLGQFLPQIHYLDENWFNANFDDFFPTGSSINCESSLGGYFFFHNNPQRQYLIRFQLAGVLVRALDYEFSSIEKEVIKIMIRQICIGYTNEVDGFSLKDELLNKILALKNRTHFSSIITYFWSPRSIFDQKEKEKLAPLWKKIFSVCKDLSDAETDRYILSGCSKWVKNILTIDDELFECLMFTTHIINQEDRYFFIEGLSVHINSQTEIVAKILNELFTQEVSYDISRGKIGDMVEVIYEAGYKELADNICLLHGEKDILFLRELYSKYNP